MTRRLDAGALELGGGLEVLLAATFEPLQSGERVSVLTCSRATAYELHGWARRAGHRAVAERLPAGGPYEVEIERGPYHRVLADQLPARAAGRRPTDGMVRTIDMRWGEEPPTMLLGTEGFTPLGAVA